jgi:2-dehydro-3-deoxygluconokinase
VADDPKAIDVVTIGEAMVALRSDGLVRLGRPLAPSVAGAESNVAIGLARLGHRAIWGGVLGSDRFGDLIERTLAAEGVRLVVSRSPAATGIVVFEERLPGVIGVDYARRGSAGSEIAPALAARALEGSPRILHLTGITPALSPRARQAVDSAIERARDLGVTISLDLNHRARLWSRDAARAELSRLAPLCDLVIASADELDLAVADPAADAVASLLDAGVTEVVVTAGGEGATRHDADGAIHVDAVRVTAVDPVGAGDAFTAGYLSGMLDGLDPLGRLQRGAVLGAFAVAARGDWEGLPRRDELDLVSAADGTTLR